MTSHLNHIKNELIAINGDLKILSSHPVDGKTKRAIASAYGNIKSACSFLDRAMAILKSPHRNNNQNRH